MKRRSSNSFEDDQIIEGFNNGKRARQLHDELGIPISTLNNKWRRYLARGSVTALPRSGRPKKTTDREDILIVRESKKDPFMTAQQIAINIGRPDISPMTIRRRLRNIGKLKCHVASKKPLLSRKNRLARLKWAREHVNWTLDQWKQVLWTDESKFCIRNHASRKVYRPSGKRLDPKYTQKTVKHDKSVMIWGCFSYHGVGRLYRIHRIMDARVYHMILQYHMFPSARALYGASPWIFQQDNDPKHSSGLIRRYLFNKRVNVLTWPSQSPDLNPIENLWSKLEIDMKTRNCNTEVQLMEILQASWDSLDANYLKKLVESMSNRCRAVILARGNGTKY